MGLKKIPKCYKLHSAITKKHKKYTEDHMRMWKLKMACIIPLVLSTMCNITDKLHVVFLYIYIQQDTMLHSLFGNCSTCFGWEQTTHHQERKQLYLQHLVFVKPLLLSAASSR
jgi:hypothetical protein